MTAEAEAKISRAIEKELDSVDKHCMRPLQVSFVAQGLTNLLQTFLYVIGEGIHVQCKVLRRQR